MEEPGGNEMTVTAELRVPVATTRLVRFDMAGPVDNTLRDEESYWLDLCLTPRPRNARACYRDRWSPHRFERLGRVFLLPPRETMLARSDGGSTQTSLLCHLRPEPLRHWFDDELQWSDPRLAATLDVPDDNIRVLLLRLAEELRHPGFASEALVELMVAQIAIELARYCVAIPERALASGGLAAWRLKRIDERLREPGDAPTLAELAVLCGLSVRQLARGFRVSRGQSIGDHIAGQRLDQARAMLHGEQSVKAIAYTLGFASPSSFCFAFRRGTGATPSEYRHQVARAA